MVELISHSMVVLISHSGTTTTTVVVDAKATVIKRTASLLVRIAMASNLHNDLEQAEPDTIAEVLPLRYLDQNVSFGFIIIPDSGFRHFALAQFS